MARYAELEASVGTKTDSAVLLTFYEGEPEEQEEWVPLSLLEDPSVIDHPDANGYCIVSVAKWFLKDKGIPYDSVDPTDKK
jgi:hypothetical protein